MSYVIGIDVGTSSVRGALVNQNGKIMDICSSSITTWNSKPNFYQQSTDQIWLSCCSVIRKLVKNISPESVKGLGFDATCSLAVLDGKGKPVSVDRGGNNEQNVILWLDHRAHAEAHFINQTKHDILKYLGGSISLEMMIPKLLWLKKNHPECWKEAGHFFVLPDFLTWRATGVETRSLCSVSYFRSFNSDNIDSEHPSLSSWNKDFFDMIGLADLAENDWKKIGNTVMKPGDLCGTLSAEAAKELGLHFGTPVAVSMIDAYAGGLGVMGCMAENVSADFVSRLAMICGTSTCHMTQTKQKIHIPGLWGPYFGPMIPGLWFIGGGQSATGKLLDHIISTHPAAESIIQKSGTLHITEYLNGLLCRMAKKRSLTSIDELSKDVHIWPDFHGNRTPLADPRMRGMINGLTLAQDEEDLAILYLAAVQSLVYGTKHIIDVMTEYGHNTLESIIICGGLAKNELFVQTHANAIALQVLVPEETESVLLGAAVLGASAAGLFAGLDDVVMHMAGPARHVKASTSTLSYHKRKYAVFLEMLEHQNLCKLIMNDESDEKLF